MLAAEQERIKSERAQATKSAQGAVQDAEDIRVALDEAVRLVRGAAIAYSKASPITRRVLNQCLFDALFIIDETVVAAGYRPWAASLKAVGGSVAQAPAARHAARTRGPARMGRWPETT